MGNDDNLPNTPCLRKEREMKIEQYYIAPPQKVFDEIKENSMKIWQTYDNTYGYVDEKIKRIKDVTNFKDNAWYIVGMFDSLNRLKLLNLVSKETAEMIMDAVNTGKEVSQNE